MNSNVTSNDASVTPDVSSEATQLSLTIEDEEEIMERVEREKGEIEGGERGEGEMNGEKELDSLSDLLSLSASLSSPHTEDEREGEGEGEREGGEERGENEFSRYVSTTFVPLRYNLWSFLSMVWNVYCDVLAIFGTSTKCAIRFLR